jgi:putative ABC transport system ATP-binding protein
MHEWQSWIRKLGSQGVHNGTSSTSRRIQAVGSTRSGERHPGFSEAMISLRGITKAYKTDAGPFWALKGIDLQIYRGEFVAVVGKSGSGKSTLINMFTGIDHPTEGEVIVAQRHIRELSEGQMAEWRGRQMGIVFQFFQLLPTLTIAENVMLPMDLCEVYEPGERYDRAVHLLEQVGMADYAQKFPTAVSGGHQQRAAIARALANDPPIVVADEPTGNLDSKTADAVFGLFESLVAGGKTILMVTHDDELASLVPRSLTLADGLIVDEVVRLSAVAAPPLLRWVPDLVDPSYPAYAVP